MRMRYHSHYAMTSPLLIEDFGTRTWARLQETLLAELAALRVANDNMSLGPTETAFLRGKVTAIKKILRLADEAPGENRADPQAWMASAALLPSADADTLA